MRIRITRIRQVDGTVKDVREVNVHPLSITPLEPGEVWLTSIEHSTEDTRYLLSGNMRQHDPKNIEQAFEVMQAQLDGKYPTTDISDKLL